MNGNIFVSAAKTYFMLFINIIAAPCAQKLYCLMVKPRAILYILNILRLWERSEGTNTNTKISYSPKGSDFNGNVTLNK